MADVFISYAREEKDFVRKVHEALAAQNRDTWVDWEDIPLTAEWLKEIEAGIEAAHTFVFVISPDSVTSEICRREIDHAVKHHKRLVPLVRRDVDDKAVPQAVAALNWIFCRESDDFASACASLITAIDTDLDWVRAHTHWLARAIEWEGRGQDTSLLLRGNGLKGAEHWLTQAGAHKEPQPTPLQTQYIIASRKAATTRQRVMTGAVTFGLIVAIVLAVVAFYQRNEAERRSFVSLSQSLSTQALLQHTQGDRNERAALLARQAYVFNQRYKGHVLAQVDNALRTVLSTDYPPIVLNVGQLGVDSIAFSRNGKTLASGSKDSTIRLWDLSKPDAEPQILGRHDLEVTSVAFSLDGKTLASGSWDRTIRVWDLFQSGTKPRVLRGHEGYVYTVAFSPDGKTLASGGDGSSIHLWDVSNFQAEPRVLRGHESGVLSVAFSPDGKTLASGSWDSSIRLWDLSNPRPEPILLRGHKDRVRSVAFSPDGKTLAASDGTTVWLWDLVYTSGEPQILPGHEWEVTAVTFSPDGSTLASGSLDKTVRLWDLTNPDAEPVVLRGHMDGVSSLAFSPDGKTLASGSYDKTVFLRIAKTEILVDFVCKKARNSLALNDWNRFVGVDLPYEPTCPNRPLHPSLLLTAEDLARSGDLDRAAVLFKRASELDPNLVLDPAKEAKKFAAEGLIIQGRNLARKGDEEGAVALFQKALELNPGLTLDPKAEAKAGSR